MNARSDDAATVARWKVMVGAKSLQSGVMSPCGGAEGQVQIVEG